MRYGTIYRSRLSSVLPRKGEEVICLECLEPTVLKIVDYGFGDDFGGFVNWELRTDCCESDNYRSEGCDSCGKILTLKPFLDCFYCETCHREAEEEG